MDNSFQIILIGSGNYVCGGTSKDYGTILPAIITFAKLNSLKIIITVAINHHDSAINFSKKISELMNLLSAKNFINYTFIFCEGSPTKFINEYKSFDLPKACIISVPDHLHYIWSENLIKAKIPLLIVKPLTLKLKDSLKLLKLSKNLSTPIYAEFHKRYDRQLKYARDVFRKGIIGEPLYAYTEYTQKKEIPLRNFKSWANLTNIFSYLGVHYVDAMKYITNASPKRISATGQKNFLVSNDLNTFDTIQCNLEWEFQNKKTFNQIIMCSWIESNNASAISKQDFHIIGTKGRLDCEQKDRGLSILTDNIATESINPDFTRMYSYLDSNIFEGYGIDSVTNFLRKIFLTDGSENLDSRLCTIEDSLESTAAIEGCYQSINNNSNWVDINL